MSLEAEIAAFDKMRRTLEAKHKGEWAVVHGGKLIGCYPNFEAAATDAETLFEQGPCLIRQVGVELVHVNATMTFRPAHANSARRV